MRRALALAAIALVVPATAQAVVIDYGVRHTKIAVGCEPRYRSLHCYQPGQNAIWKIGPAGLVRVIARPPRGFFPPMPSGRIAPGGSYFSRNGFSCYALPKALDCVAPNGRGARFYARVTRSVDYRYAGGV